MSLRIVYDTSVTTLEENGYTILEEFDFGNAGHAVLVETPEKPLQIQSTADEIGHVDYDFELEPLALATGDSDFLATYDDARKLHNIAPDLPGSGEGTTVAAIDSGVDTSKSLFDDVNFEEVDCTGDGNGDRVGHGTAVLGQVTQVAPDADLVMLRVLNDEGRASLSTVYRAYDWLESHQDEIDVVNISLGSSQTSTRFDQIHNDLFEETGIQDVVAAGNSGGPSGSPATAAKAFSVGACTEEGAMADFSSYNPKANSPEVTALGENVKLLSASNVTMGEKVTEDWVKASGTSFSAPLIAGLIAKGLSAGEENIRDRLVETAQNLNGTERDGHGLVDYQAAVRDLVKEDTGSAKVWKFAGTDSLFLNKDWLKTGSYEVTKREEEGEITLTFEKQ